MALSFDGTAQSSPVLSSVQPNPAQPRPAPPSPAVSHGHIPTPDGISGSGGAGRLPDTRLGGDRAGLAGRSGSPAPAPRPAAEAPVGQKDSRPCPATGPASNPAVQLFSCPAVQLFSRPAAQPSSCPAVQLFSRSAAQPFSSCRCTGRLYGRLDGRAGSSCTAAAARSQHRNRLYPHSERIFSAPGVTPHTGRWEPGSVVLTGDTAARPAQRCVPSGHGMGRTSVQTTAAEV